MRQKVPIPLCYNTLIKTKERQNMNYNNLKDLERILTITGNKPTMTSTDYQMQISDLYKEWKSRVNSNNTPFVTDGVMDPEQWFKRAERIMFVIKETYSDKHEKDWDLAADHVLSNEKIGQKTIWRNISLWAKGMQYICSDYNPYDKDLESFGNEYLHRIAVLSIKKYNGTSTSNDEDIIHYADQEKDLIEKEIEICDPNVIVCCGTAKALSKVIDFNYEQKNNECFYHTFINGHEVIVIDFFHPDNRYPKIMNCFTLCSIYQRAKNAQVKRVKTYK